MSAVVEKARAGMLVIGICNGFQILCEAGLLPGALVRNRSLRFVCEMVTTRVEVAHSPFTIGCPEGTLLRLPVAHGEGCFFADEETLRELNENRQVICVTLTRGRSAVGESERLAREHRGHLQSRAKRVRPHAAPGPRVRGAARQRGRCGDFPFHDAGDRGQARAGCIAEACA